MKLLIVDVTTEAQAFCAKRIELFGKSDIEMLDLKVKLIWDLSGLRSERRNVARVRIELVPPDAQCESERLLDVHLIQQVLIQRRLLPAKAAATSGVDFRTRESA